MFRDRRLGAVQDVVAHRASRRCWLVPQLRCAAQPLTPPARCRRKCGRGTPADEHRGWTPDHLRPRSRASVDTRATLARWNAATRGSVLARGCPGARASPSLLLARLGRSRSLSTPDPTPVAASRPQPRRRARRRRPRPVPQLARARAARDGLRRRLHRRLLAAARGEQLHAASGAGSTSKAGPLAIAFVVGATTFSLATQAFVLGGGASTLAAQLGISPGLLLLGLLPHALPELIALFLPLAAWIIASRRGRVGPAARGDVRDGRHRRPGAGRARRSSRSTSRRTCSRAGRRRIATAP